MLHANIRDTKLTITQRPIRHPRLQKKSTTNLSNPRTDDRTPTLMPPETLTVTRTLSTSDGCTAYFATTSRGEKVIVWRGGAPDLPIPLNPILGVGTLEEENCWLEGRPGELCLGDLALPVPEVLLNTLAFQLAGALSLLHDSDIVHGSIDKNAVVIDASGACSWVGTARVEGSEEHDLAALMTLLIELGLHDGLPTEPVRAAALADRLRSRPQDRAALAAWIAAHPEPPSQPEHHQTLMLNPIGLMDEVQHELGADAAGHGLLDRWDHTEDGVDLTDDSTESVVMGSHHAQTRQHILSELFIALDAAIAAPQPPSPTFRRGLSAEPLDPLVALNGLRHDSIHNPQSVSERTAEVSTPETTTPSLHMTDETTGSTGLAPIQQSVLTGLLMAAVLGMVGAAVMLTLVWVILGEVF